jgi:hypothetical protein
LAKNQETEKVKLALKNLKEEIELKNQIEKELSKMLLVKLNETAGIDNPQTGEKVWVNFYLTRNADKNDFTIEAKADNIKITKNIKSINDIKPFVVEINASKYDDLVTGTTKD